MANELDMSVKVFPAKSSGNLLALASVTIAESFAVRDIRIMNSEKGPFVAMPSRKNAKGEYQDICFPVTAEMRQRLNDAVLNEFEKELRKEIEKEKKPSLKELLSARAEKSTKATPQKKHNNRSER